MHDAIAKPNAIEKARLQAWRAEIDAIYCDLAELFWLKSVFEQVETIVVGNPLLPRQNTFYAWMTYAYVCATSVGIRRIEGGRHPKEIGLLKLLSALKENVHLISCDCVFTHYREGWPRGAVEKDYKTHVGHDSDMTKEDVQCDLNELKSKVEIIRSHVDKKIAHRDADAGELRNIDWQEHDDAFVCLERLVRKYTYLLSAAYAEIRPVRDSRWTDIFLMPWKASTGDHSEEKE